MTEKRYYEKNYGEEYYIFDSNTISENEFEEKVEYEGYDVFGDSLTGDEVIDLLNENEKLKKENNKWIVDYNGLNTEYQWLKEENEQLKQRINSRLHFYRGLYESTNDKVVERVIEDLEDILKR